jgi:hypothetical protein
MHSVKVSKTFDTWTPEDASFGNTDNHGYEYEDREYSADTVAELVAELFDLVRDELGRVEASQYPLQELSDSICLSSSDPEQDYTTGGNTFYSLHFAGLTPEIGHLLAVALKQHGLL